MIPLTLRTARLVLREWRDDDVEPFAQLCGDPVVMRYMMPLDSRAAVDATVGAIRGHFARHGFGFWAVELPGEAPFIGMVGLAVVAFAAHFAPAVEIGWRLARRHWGRGFAGEAAAAALDAGFSQLDLREIVAFTVPANEPSWRLMRRLGMHRNPQDDFDHPRVPDGHPLRRHVLYRISSEEWQSSSAKS